MASSIVKELMRWAGKVIQRLLKAFIYSIFVTHPQKVYRIIILFLTLLLTILLCQIFLSRISQMKTSQVQLNLDVNRKSKIGCAGEWLQEAYKGMSLYRTRMGKDIIEFGGTEAIQKLYAEYRDFGQEAFVDVFLLKLHNIERWDYYWCDSPKPLGQLAEHCFLWIWLDEGLTKQRKEAGQRRAMMEMK